MEITNEQLLQKIGTLVVLTDIQQAQYQDKIKELEIIIKQLKK